MAAVQSTRIGSRKNISSMTADSHRIYAGKCSYGNDGTHQPREGETGGKSRSRARNMSIMDADSHRNYGGKCSYGNDSQPREGETSGKPKTREDELISFTGTWIDNGRGKGTKK